jgi:tight adherence protein B
MLSVLAAVAIGAALFALVRGVNTAITADHRRSQTRLHEISGDAPPASRRRDRKRERRRRAATSEGDDAGTSARTRSWLRRGGLAWEPTDLAGVELAAALTPAALVAVVTGGNLAASLAVGAVTVWVPLILIQRRVARRRAALNAQVVETLEVVTSSLRSGFGFTQALDLAAREQPDPIRTELLQTMREVSLGASTDEALERLVERTGDEDLALAINAVVIQRRVGGDLSEILGNIAGMIRERVRIRGEIQTITAQARMSAWIVGLLPIGLAAVLTVMQPDQMRVLIDDPVGRGLVAVGVFLQVVGFLAVRKIAAIKY